MHIYQELFSVGEKPTELLTEEHNRGLMQAWILLVSGEVRGFCFVNTAEGDIFIDYLGVSVRDRGYGTMLLKRVFREYSGRFRLLCEDRMIPYYERFDMKWSGKEDKWNVMVR